MRKSDQGLIESAAGLSKLKLFLNPILSVGYWTPTFAFNFAFRTMVKALLKLIDYIPTDNEESASQLEKELDVEYKNIFKIFITDITESLIANHSLQYYVPLLKQCLNCYDAYLQYAKVYDESHDQSKKIEDVTKILHNEICELMLKSSEAAVLFAKNIEAQNTVNKLFSSLDKCVADMEIPENWMKVNFLKWSQDSIAPYFN